jgi:hypothetical protein
MHEQLAGDLLGGPSGGHGLVAGSGRWLQGEGQHARAGLDFQRPLGVVAQELPALDWR